MRRFFLTLFLLLSFIQLSIAAPISIPEGSIIVDAQAEMLLTKWLGQLFQTAGINQNYKPKVYILVDSRPNAAASLGGQLLINTGIITGAKSGLEIFGVLAHEVGHIKFAHAAKFDAMSQAAMAPAVATMILGGIVSLAGGGMQGLAAATMGGAHIYERAFLQQIRTREEEADQAALSYLSKLNYSSQGLSDFFNKREIKGFINSDNPYLRTHPLSEARLKLFNEHIEKEKNKKILDFPDEKLFEILQGKFIGYFSDPKEVIRKHTGSSYKDTVARGVANYRLGNTEIAIQDLKKIESFYQSDPYIKEILGQIHLESGNRAQALTYFREANRLSQNKELIQLSLAHALIESTSASSTEVNEAIHLLKTITTNLPENMSGWYFLSMAYGRNNQTDWADYALAKYAALIQDERLAKEKAGKVLKSTSDNNLKILCQDLLKQEANSIRKGE